MKDRFSRRVVAYLTLLLIAIFLVPSMVTWAVKSGGAKPGLNPSGEQDARHIDKAALSYFQRMAAPDRERPLGLSLFENFTPNIPALPNRKGLVFTQAGFFNPKDSKAFDALPSDLRGVVAHAAPAGKGLGLGSGAGIIQISEASVTNPGYDKIEARIRELGGILVETRQDRALVVRGDAKAMAALVKEPFVEAAIPYAPAFKLDPMAGKQMLLDKVRASKMEMDVQIRAFDEKGAVALLKNLKSTHSDTVTQLDSLTIRATLDKNELKRVLKMDEVSDVHEVPEYQLSAAFVLVQDPPVVQVGEAEHTFAATPYWDAGVDGGGCGYCSNNFATACTSNAACGAGTCVHASASQCTSSIPATVVAVLDNGASLDAANLAHSTAALFEAAIQGLIAGGSHRKIAAYQLVADAAPLGTTCDNVLSGGQTHGQIVAGVIAGNASALGFTFQRSSNAGSFGDIRWFNLDGTARGARLTIQDAGASATCAVSDLEERGLVNIAGNTRDGSGNVTATCSVDGNVCTVNADCAGGGTASPPDICNGFSNGTLRSRMDAAYATAARLHVMPFGIPTWNANGTTLAGQYTSDAFDLDKYLVNNLEYMVFVPVGNKGFALLNGRDVATDLFDGESSVTSDPQSVGLTPTPILSPLQISPPSTAKNGVASGATCSDTFTMFGPFNNEENVSNYTAKGPATAASLRTAPILTGVGNDCCGPAPLGIYGVKSTDNDQGGNVDAEVSEQARGTSFGAAHLTAAAALVEDYFHQGFYPTGDRVQGDRVSVLSGSAVKAMLAASANFSGQLIGLNSLMRFMDGFDVQVATTRSSIVPIFGTPIVLGNNQQGYGRPILTQVLPLVNWANYGIPPDGVATEDTIEKPALGLLVWEHGVDTNGAVAGLGESLPVFSGAPATTQDHKFTVLGNQGQLRACMTYPDPAGELLVNDLDLELVSPKHCNVGDQSRVCSVDADCPAGTPPTCITTIYDGNVYNPNNDITGQWGLAQGGTDPGDKLNPLECVHLTEDPDGKPASTNSQIVPGTWNLRVKYGNGGSVFKTISDINGADEDANGNNRLDAGEDTDQDNRLDKGGQPYAAVISGSVVPLKGDVTTPAWFADYPTSLVRLNQIRYTCRDDASVLILDGDANVVTLPGQVSARVFNNASPPVQVDSEINFTFSCSNSTFNSVPLPVRQATTGTANNGVLEGDTDYTIEVSYADPTAESRTVVARAPMNCEPNFLGGVFVNPGARNAPDLLFGGCDNDQSFDKNETVTYSISVVNNDLFDDYTDVTATLTACNVAFNPTTHVCSAPTPPGTLAVLDSPKNIGRLPVGQPDAVTFSVQVGAGPFAAGQKVFLRLDLAATGGPKLLSRLNMEFVHPLGTDKASLHYSTDYPNGSAQITRDLNRSLVIEPNDRPGLTLGFLDETITFSSLFAVDPATGRVNNQIRSTCVTNTAKTCVGGTNPGTVCVANTDCAGGGTCLPLRAACTTDANCGGIVGSCVADEAYPALGIFTLGSGDGVLDRHLLTDVNPLNCSVDANSCATNADCAGGATPTPPDICKGNDLIPWSFDANNGGWYTARDASSAPGTTPATHPLWHWMNNGTCGFQTQSKSNCVLVDGTPGNDPDGPGAAPCAALTVGAFTGGAWHTGSGQTGVCHNNGNPGGASCYLDSDCTGGTGPCDGRCVGGGTPGAACSSSATCAPGTCIFGADYLDCGNYGVAFNTSTPRRAEFMHDYLVSPIIEKVNQGLDATGNPFLLEFQRFGFNDSVQFRYADNTLYVNLDNNTDSNSPNAIVRPGVFRGGGFAYYAFAIYGRIDPVVSALYYNQTTFGPTTDPDNSLHECSPPAPANTACSTDAFCVALPAAGSVCGFLNGDEAGFPGFDRQSTNPRATKPAVPVAPSNLRPFPGPTEVHPVGSEDTVAGPSRNVDVDLVDYEDAINFFTPGDAGNRFQIGMSFLLVENQASSGDGDLGLSIDDVVFEWDETHPVAEATAACDRIGIGGPTEIAAGCRCPTLAVDRTNLYDCNETVAITVDDSRYAAGATCDPTGTGAPDMILINVWSNSEPFPGQLVPITETGAATGIFKGTVLVTGIFNTDGPDGSVFTVPGLETNLFFAYGDSSSACDSNHDHRAGQSDFNNLDGDGLGAAAGRDGICGTSDDDPSCDPGNPVGICGADHICGFNPVSGSIDDTGDNCALIYNPAQTDADGDKFGGNKAISPTVYAGCDNCPLTYNPNQNDGDLDGVGDACDWDDVDNDGIPNDPDLCPQVPDEGHCDNGGGDACSFVGTPGTPASPLPACSGGNAAHCQPGQKEGISPRGQACDGTYLAELGVPNMDGDATPDVGDNCPLTAGALADTDLPTPGFWPALGDACDGDCEGTCGAGSTLRAPGDRCTFSSECGGPGVCGGRVCSAVDDDADIDAASDVQDNCPVSSNPTPLPGSVPPVQTDDDFNGLGNACDPAGSFDENADGLPDDVANGPFFALAVTCKNIPLAKIVLLSPVLRDRAELKTCTGGPNTRACPAGSNVGKACDGVALLCPGSACPAAGPANDNSCGDGDGFGDPGERVRIAPFLQNISGFNLTGINLALSTADPDIECILDASIQVASFPNNTALDTRTLTPVDDPAQPTDGKFFELVISPDTNSTNPATAARANMTMTLTANEAGGTVTPVAITTLLDLDLPPGAVPTSTAARCDGDLSTPATAGTLCADDAACGGAFFSCKPGLIYEGFETAGPGGNGTGGIPQPNDFSTTIGFIEHSVATGDSDTTVHGKACYQNLGLVEDVDGFCRIDPDGDTDWHFETAAAPTRKAYRGGNSGHWGRHTQATSRSGDTTPLRMVESFDTKPINLTILPTATDLFLSYWNIVSFADDNSISFLPGQSGDYADVQIAVDQDPSAVDSWGRWQKLTPFQNVAEHTPQVWSLFTDCHFTPSDAAAASNPGVYGETMCFPGAVWSHSGNVRGTNTLTIFQAQGPGALGSQGDGVWVQSKFNLGLFIGQRVKIRWVAQSWAALGDGYESYMEPPADIRPFDLNTEDDGWWLDEIQITGAITAPINPIVDPTTIPLTTQCPVGAGAECNQALGTNGFNLDFKLSDTDNDGSISPGEQILLDASQTANPGGCANGVPQFQFKTTHSLCFGGSNPGAACPTGFECTGGGTCSGETAPIVLQEWSTQASLQLSNSSPTDHFDLTVRCSSDFSCTAALTGEPVGQHGAGCAFRNFQPPATPLATHPATFTTWSFGAACAGQGAPGALLCGRTHRFDSDPDPLIVGAIGFTQPAANRRNGVITTVPLPVGVPGQVAAGPCRYCQGGTNPGTNCPTGTECTGGGTCSNADFGMCAATPWGAIGALSAGAAICGVPGGPVFDAGVNSCNPPSPGLACPAGPLLDVTCGDATAIAVNTVQYYLAGVHSRADAAGGCACTTPACVAAGSVAFVHPNALGVAGGHCYRWDDDPAAGSPAIFNPGGGVGFAGCP